MAKRTVTERLTQAEQRLRQAGEKLQQAGVRLQETADRIEAVAEGRLTRAESRQRTRERLLDAAADVFNRLGYHGASLEAVAEAAGYTKGAVYSNFATKGELFLALCQRGTEMRGDVLRTLLREHPLDEFIELLTDALAAQVTSEREFDLLQIEFWLAAMRDPALRDVLATAGRSARAEIAAELESKLASEGGTAPFTSEDLVTLVTALANGVLLQQYLDPASVEPDLLARAIRRLLGIGEPSGR